MYITLFSPKFSFTNNPAKEIERGVWPKSASVSEGGLQSRSPWKLWSIRLFLRDRRNSSKLYNGQIRDILDGRQETKK